MTVAFAQKAKARRLPETWGDGDDNALRDTGGVYSQIAKMSDRRGIAETVLVARWHLLRAGAAPRPAQGAGVPSCTNSASLQRRLPPARARHSVQPDAALRDAIEASLNRVQARLVDLLIRDGAADVEGLSRRMALRAQGIRKLLHETARALAPLGLTVARRSVARGRVIYQLEFMK